MEFNNGQLQVANLLLLSSLVVSIGCTIGPRAIERSHGRYAEAVQRVEEEQFLAQIVRMRYAESSTEVAVAAIASQHEISAGVEARPFFGTESVSGPVFQKFNSIMPFVGVNGSDRPTVSLTPQNDGEFVRQLLTPISTDTLVFLGQTGWPISTILRIWVYRLNGVPNWVATHAQQRDAPSDFHRFLQATEHLQAAQDLELLSLHLEYRDQQLGGPLPVEAVSASALVDAAKEGFEYRPADDGESWLLVKSEPHLVLQVNQTGQNSLEMAEISNLLKLEPGLDRYEVVLASGVPDPAKFPSQPSNAIRVSPRSTTQAMFYLSNGIEVPAQHLECGLAPYPLDGIDPTEVTQGVFRVLSCPGKKHQRPACAFVAVWYRDHWFYIDDRDHESKSTLFLMLNLRRLDFRRQQVGSVPALTLPLGR